MMSASTSSASSQPGFEQSGGEALAGLIERVHAPSVTPGDIAASLFESAFVLSEA
jgi:hypothetical protein